MGKLIVKASANLQINKSEARVVNMVVICELLQLSPIIIEYHGFCKVANRIAVIKKRFGFKLLRNGEENFGTEFYDSLIFMF